MGNLAMLPWPCGVGKLATWAFLQLGNVDFAIWLKNCTWQAIQVNFLTNFNQIRQ
jgi:hypothetical protein